MYKLCGNTGEYTLHLCNYFTIWVQDFDQICRIFICVFNAYTGSKSPAWAFLNVGGNAVLNGTIYVTYKDTWTPAVGDYVRVLDCAGSISGNPTFELQALPAGLEWDTTPFLSTGTIRVAVSTGIKEVGLDGGSFKADVYTIGGFKLTSLMTTKATMMSDLKNRGLAAGTYIVRTAQGGIKITLK